MNKVFLQQVFNQQVGYVYQYVGTVPAGQSKNHYITEQFAQAAGSNLVATVVTTLDNSSVVLIYNNADSDQISDPNFILITDLLPDVVAESDTIEEEPVANESDTIEEEPVANENTAL